MDELDRSLLVKLQREFPLSPRPYQALGEALGLSEEQVLDRVAGLRMSGVVRQVSAIFDSRRLGYQSVLVAAKVEAKGLEAAAAVVSAHPGVSHNYERAHDYNLWFTLAVSQDSDLSGEVAALASLARFSAWRILPALKTYKIEVSLDPKAEALGRVQAPQILSGTREPMWLSQRDKQAVRLLQEDLPVLARPFLATAAALGMSEDELFDWMAEAGRLGILRRFAGILRHRQAGFSANGMGVWTASPGSEDAAGRLFASYRAVSHCYLRPTFPDWPYNLFTMVHARTLPECAQVFEELSQASGISDYKVILSLREFKKERVKYFLEGRFLPPTAAARKSAS